MKTLTINKKKIEIFTEEEVLEKGKELHKYYTDPLRCADYLDYQKKHYENLIKEPMPYKLFRWNEMTGYTLNYKGVEITEEQYRNRIEQLPPIDFKYGEFTGYIIPECITDTIYEHVFEHKGKTYCVIMQIQNKETLQRLRFW